MRAIVTASDLILVMSPAHLARVQELEPAANVHLIASYKSGDISGETIQDPFGGDLDAYRETADELERLLADLLERIPAP